MASVSRILLPTGFSELSRRAAEYVKLLLPALGAELHVVSVVPHAAIVVDPGIPGAGGLPIAGPAPGEMIAQGRERLAAFVQDVFPNEAGRVHAAVVMGSIAEELLRYVQEHSIDLIVMGTHADRVLKRVIWGSVGKSVLEGSTCPVLLVPGRDAPRV
ncbi:MAG: universal stress protein [Phycisphaerales bacterium]